MTIQDFKKETAHKDLDDRVIDTERDFRALVLPSMFWRPTYLELSAWAEHIPFAFWVMEAHKPRKLVELGTHWGTSYFSFCQAVSRLNLGTRCYAIDTWEGDDHTGDYGPEVFNKVQNYNDAHYSGFSRLVQSTFEDAAAYFSDKSIDLLHIDGFHTYDAVRRDFEMWLPKMSEYGLILFHDTNVRERGFGVFRLLAELKTTYSVFEFFHGHGLGVVAIGKTQSDLLVELFNSTNDRSVSSSVRNMFSRLGKGCWDAMQLQRKEDAVKEWQEERREIEKKYKEKYDAYRAKLDKQNREIERLKVNIRVREEQLSDVKNSLSWRVTGPLRFIGQAPLLIVRSMGRLVGGQESPGGDIRVGALVTEGRDGKPPSASPYIRLIQPLTHPHAREQGIVFDWFTANTIERCREFDVVIVQRNIVDIVKARTLVESLRERGIPLIFDIDDALHLIDRDDPRFAAYNKARDRYEPALEYFMRQADCVWFSTAVLEAEYRRFASNGIVIENALDERLWPVEIARQSNPLTDNFVRFLYYGVALHDPDFAEVLKAFDEISERYEGRFNLTIVGALSEVPNRAWLKEIPVPSHRVPYSEFARWLPQQGPFDCGLAPLEDNPHNRCKSDLKILTYSAMGIVTIASEVTPYKEICKDVGIGVTVRHDSENWATALADIIERPAHYRPLAEKATQYMRENRSLESVIVRQVHTIKELAKRMRSHRRRRDARQRV